MPRHLGIAAILLLVAQASPAVGPGTGGKTRVTDPTACPAGLTCRYVAGGSCAIANSDRVQGIDAAGAFGSTAIIGCPVPSTSSTLQFAGAKVFVRHSSHGDRVTCSVRAATWDGRAWFSSQVEVSSGAPFLVLQIPAGLYRYEGDRFLYTEGAVHEIAAWGVECDIGQGEYTGTNIIGVMVMEAP